MQLRIETQPQMQNLLQHKILNDNVLTVPIDFVSDDVVLEAPSYEEKPEWALIIDVGKDVEGLVAGDVVLFMAYGGTKVQALGQDFIYVREEDVISVYTPPQKPEIEL